MPTISEVITEVDALKSNAFTEQIKADWIIRLEGKISRDIHKTEAVKYEYPDNMDISLSVEFPSDELYSLYVQAMIDLNNHEYGGYENSMAVFNQAYADYEKWYNKTHEPAGAGNFRNLL